MRNTGCGVIWPSARRGDRLVEIYGIVQPWQNNYCGLAATGSSYRRWTRGALPGLALKKGYMEPYLLPEDGVEAVQSLCLCRKTAGRNHCLTRVLTVNRGCAPCWVDLGESGLTRL